MKIISCSSKHFDTKSSKLRQSWRKIHKSFTSLIIGSCVSQSNKGLRFLAADRRSYPGIILDHKGRVIGFEKTHLKILETPTGQQRLFPLTCCSQSVNPSPKSCKTDLLDRQYSQYPEYFPCKGLEGHFGKAADVL